MLERIKPMPDLVCEILDQLPNEVWTSETTTFFNPSIGGGQFQKEIENRLRSQGHSDDNIKSRVFGLETTTALIDMAVNMYGLVGQYAKMSVDDFLAAEPGVKYDVVFSAPKFNSLSKSTEESADPKRKTGNKLWYQYAFKLDTLVKDNGYVAMITPNQWLTGGVQQRKGNLGILKDIFAKKQLLVAKVAGVTEKYFKGIGVSIGWWVYQNTAVYKKSKLLLADSTVDIDFSGLEFLTPEPNETSIGIVTKVLLSKNTKFESYYFNSQCEKGSETEEQTAVNKYPHWIYGSSTSNNLVIRYFPEVKNDKVNYKKILFPMSTRYWQPYLAEANISVASLGQALRVDDVTTQEGFESVFYSRLFRYLCFNLQIAQNGFMKTVLVKSLPKLDMSRVWTDKELFEHFNLSTEEQEYIVNSTTKKSVDKTKK